MNRVLSVLDLGTAGLMIDVECHMSNGLPAIIIVGSANRAVDEARERVRSAFASCNLNLPRKRITINLAPADIPKESTSFDLAIVAAILLASGQALAKRLANTPVIGELGLDGSVRAVRGIIGKLLASRDCGYNQFYIPAANLPQAQLVPGIVLIPVINIMDFSGELNGMSPLRHIAAGGVPVRVSQQHSVELQDIAGQERAKRALQIAAAGSHNLLLSGPPGTGKSMLAKAVPSILPAVTPEEMLEITHLHSLASHQYDQIITSRPFRAPHHSASTVSIIGGGHHSRPGEVSLSHRGVLFLDEISEYNRMTIEALRQPLEDQVITITRAKNSITFPAQFMLIATCNPCPCGNYGTTLECRCPPFQVMRYQQKLSGPILDRIDLYVEVDQVSHATLLKGHSQATSATVQNQVNAARDYQQQRYQNPLKTNAWLQNRDIKKYCSLSSEATSLLNRAAGQLKLSARSYMKTLKVARTIADLDQSDSITIAHLTEALQYRRPLATLF